MAAEEAFSQQVVNAGVGADGVEVLGERFDPTGEAAAFVALHNANDLDELCLITSFPWFISAGESVFACRHRAVRGPPVVHIEPLDMADVHRRLHLRLALDEDGLDVAALHAQRDGDLFTAHAGVTGGMFGKEGKNTQAFQSSVGDLASPVVAEFDLVLVEPDVVPALFQIGLDAADEFLIGVVAVAEEDAERGERFLRRELEFAGVAKERRRIRNRHRLGGLAVRANHRGESLL